MDSKEVASAYNKVLQNRGYMNGLYNQSCDQNDVLRTLSGVLECLVASRKFTPNEYLKNPYMVLRYLYFCGLNNDKIEENIFSNPILCHAFNGDNYEKVLQYGLGDYRVLDKKYLRMMDEIESAFESLDTYYHFQLNKRNEFFAGFPGFAEMEFVTKNSPERHFLGIFNQKIAQSEPIIMGETKKGYYTRVIDHKIDALENCLDKDRLKCIGHKIVNKFCSKRPILALFDAVSKDGEYNLITRDCMKCKDMPIKEYIFLQSDRILNPTEAFSRSTCGKNLTDLDDMGIYDSIVPGHALGLVEMPDSYEIKQYLAFIRGCEWGDLIDFHSGKRVYIDDFIRKREIDKSGQNDNLIPLKEYKQSTEIDILSFFENKKLVESEMENYQKRSRLKLKLIDSSKQGVNLLQKEENVVERVAFSKKLSTRVESCNKDEQVLKQRIEKIKSNVLKESEMSL